MKAIKSETGISTIEEVLTSDNEIISFDLIIKRLSQNNRRLKFMVMDYSIIRSYAPVISSYAAQGGDPP